MSILNRKNNLIYKKIFNFSIRIINLYKYLSKEKKEYILAKQLLRCGTSIGANIREGLDGQSKKDFIAKFSISLKEAGETEYWLELLVASDILKRKQVESLLSDIEEIIKILTSILKTSRERINN